MFRTLVGFICILFADRDIGVYEISSDMIQCKLLRLPAVGPTVVLSKEVVQPIAVSI